MLGPMLGFYLGNSAREILTDFQHFSITAMASMPYCDPWRVLLDRDLNMMVHIFHLRNLSRSVG